MMSAIAKIILAIASDPEDAKKALGIVCGIAAGAIALLLLPVYLLCAVFSGAEPADPATKNSTDLAAWARRAYLEQWEYEDGAVGAMNPARGVRTVSNIGLPKMRRQTALVSRITARRIRCAGGSTRCRTRQASVCLTAV